MHDSLERVTKCGNINPRHFLDPGQACPSQISKPTVLQRSWHRTLDFGCSTLSSNKFPSEFFAWIKKKNPSPNGTRSCDLWNFTPLVDHLSSYKPNFDQPLLKNFQGQFGQASYVMKLYNFNKTEGFFVEAGAYDGVTASNTLLMETRYGWSGDDDHGP